MQALFLQTEKLHTKKKLEENWTGGIEDFGIVFENGKTAKKNPKKLQQNWTGGIEEIKRIIHLWSKRDLSVKGKIVVVKCSLVSQLIHIMPSIGIPEIVLTDLS